MAAPLQVHIFEADSRRMPELADASVDLVVTSPPYWHLKDYGVPGQIGYGQSLHEYLRDLYRVWEEVFRVLRPGRRLCINIGDQFARARVYGRYKVIPLHAEIIAQAEQIGFDYLGAIIWQKKTTMNTSGGAVVMGSYPYPPNGIVEIDYEYILLFKKPGKPRQVPKEIKEASRLSKEEWKTYFSGHWTFGGARKKARSHEAPFPPELPRRLIRMFSFVGETVLDPFAGSGTTLEQAVLLGRHAVGYEIVPEFVSQMQARLQPLAQGLFATQVTVQRRAQPLNPLPAVSYRPSVHDARPQRDPAQVETDDERYYRVQSVLPDGVVLDSGLQVEFLGLVIADPEGYQAYARRYLQGKRVFLRDARGVPPASAARQRAYVYLKNRIFVNAHLLKSGLARPSAEPHRLREKFLAWAQEAQRHG